MLHVDRANYVRDRPSAYEDAPQLRNVPSGWLSLLPCNLPGELDTAQLSVRHTWSVLNYLVLLFNMWCPTSCLACACCGNVTSTSETGRKSLGCRQRLGLSPCYLPPYCGRDRQGGRHRARTGTCRVVQGEPQERWSWQSLGCSANRSRPWWWPKRTAREGYYWQFYDWLLNVLTEPLRTLQCYSRWRGGSKLTLYSCGSTYYSRKDVHSCRRLYTECTPDWQGRERTSGTAVNNERLGQFFIT